MDRQCFMILDGASLLRKCFDFSIIRMSVENYIECFFYIDMSRRLSRNEFENLVILFA